MRSCGERGRRVSLESWQRETASALLRDGGDDWDVHRNTVRGGLVDTLATAFPVTQRIVGVRAFATLADAFVRAEPPRVPQLSAYGTGFADFIAAGDVGQRLAYLADVARLEWARAESYFAADAPALDPTRLAALTPEEMERAVLRLHPATRLLESAFPIQRIWDVNQSDDVPAVDMRVAETVLVTRPGLQIVQRKIVPADAVLIKAIAAGATLGKAAVVVDESFDLQAALAAHFVGATFAA